MRDFQDALHIFPTNKQVQRHNSKCAVRLRERAAVYSLKAVDTYGDGAQVGQKANEQFVPSETNKCAGIAALINLGIGSRVMLLRNVDVRGQLCNGSLGTVVSFKWQCLRHRPREGSFRVTCLR